MILSKVTDYRDRIMQQLSFLHASNEQLEDEIIRTQYHLHYHPKAKHLGINLVKNINNLYAEASIFCICVHMRAGVCHMCGSNPWKSVSQSLGKSPVSTFPKLGLQV